MAKLIEAQPEFPVKWRDDSYLARDLSEIERARSQIHTVALLSALFPERRLRGLVGDGLGLWRTEASVGAIEIRLAVSRSELEEGELSLVMAVEDHPTAVLSFNVLPGDVRDQADPARLLISRMQTYSYGRSQAKDATRALRGVIPQTALFCAFQGMAQTLGISTFAGVPASRQVSLRPSNVDRGAETYDRFFESVGGVLGTDGFYAGPVFSEPKPLSDIAQGHRGRARHRRQIKTTIRQSVSRALEALKTDGQPGELEPCR